MSNMNLFDEIRAAKQDLPEKDQLSKDLKEVDFNFYQVFAISLFILFFVLGIFLGNLFATCQATSYFYSDQCMVTEFNFSMMIVIWFIGILLSVFFYAIGHIVSLLSEISQKLSKFRL